MDGAYECPFEPFASWPVHETIIAHRISAATAAAAAAAPITTKASAAEC